MPLARNGACYPVHGVHLDGILKPPSRLIPRKRGVAERRAPWRLLEGRPFSPARRRIAILASSLPSPGEIEDAAREFDLLLFAFAPHVEADYTALLECCARIVLVGPSSPRGESFALMRFLWTDLTRELGADVRHIEALSLAGLGGDLLVLENEAGKPWTRWIRDCAERFWRRSFRLVLRTSRRGPVSAEIYHDLIDGRVLVRAATEADVPGLDRIQHASPGAVIWEPRSYLAYDCRVAISDGDLAGFIVCRALPAGESEVLSLVVHPAWRRRGIATRLLRGVFAESPRATWYLEVRESNTPARNLYRKLGFLDVATRPNYYQDTGETAVVMRL